MSLSPKDSFYIKFEEMLSFPHLYEAYKKALKGKRLKKEVYEFGNNIIENILNIQQKLLNNIFEFGPYRSFIKFDSKRRYIVATPFKDRVVHWIVYDYLVALYDKSFIYDSFGNRANKGTQAGMLRAKQFMTKKDSNYILKIDFSKYFYSIHHEILLNELSKKVKNTYVFRLLEKLITSYRTPDIFDSIFHANSTYFLTNDKGMPIGSLTSQIFANIYLNKLDHYVKDYLKIKHYIRYVDDLVFFVKNKDEAEMILENINIFCTNKLKLEINPKKISIFPISQGLDFLGYRIYKYKILPRKRTQKKIRKALLVNNNMAITSYLGILLNTNSKLLKIAIYNNEK